MRIEDGLVVFLALATGGVLLAGLAQALDGRARPEGRRRMAHPRLGRQARVRAAPFPAPPTVEVPAFEPIPEAVEREPMPAPATPIEGEARSGDPRSELVSVAPGPAPRSTLALEAGHTRGDVAMGPLSEPAEVETSGPSRRAMRSLGEALETDVDRGVAAPGPGPGGPPPGRPAIAPAPEAPLPPAARAPATTRTEEPAARPALVPLLDVEPFVEKPDATPAPADIGTCLRAYEAGDYGAAESVAAALARRRAAGKRRKRGDGGDAPLEQVALWSALALSRRSRDDDAGAAAAFEAGARWAAAVTSRRPPDSVDRLAPQLGRHLLTVGEAMGDGSPARRAVLRLAATWLVAGAAAEPGDGDTAALADRAGEGFAAAVTADVAEHIERRDFSAAHAAIEDALGGIAVPEARRGELRDLLWTSVTGEVGRLVGQALHGAGGAAEAGDTPGTGRVGGGDGLAALRAAALVAAEVPPETLSPERHRDLEHRLWWAHMQLGGELRARGQLDAALAPLLHALELAAGDPPRAAEAREAVALVIEALAERLGQEIRQHLRAGDLDDAMAASRRLGAVVDDALSRGLSPADLVGALARRQEVLLELAEGQTA